MDLFKDLLLCAPIGAPIGAPRARISDERLFEELNWRPELSFATGRGQSTTREHSIESVVYSITSVIWPGGFDAQLRPGAG